MYLNRCSRTMLKDVALARGAIEYINSRVNSVMSIGLSMNYDVATRMYAYFPSLKPHSCVREGRFHSCSSFIILFSLIACIA